MELDTSMAEQTQPPSRLTPVRTIDDSQNLNYVVNAYIYDENPSMMVVTSRGSGGGNAGLWKVRC